MHEKYNKILKYNHGEKSMKVPFIIYAELKCLLKKLSIYHNNREKSPTTKKTEHTPSGSLLTCCSFDTTKNTLDCYRDKDCIERFCKDLKEHVTKIINNKKRNDTIKK